jgi:hypothetical protein
LNHHGGGSTKIQQSRFPGIAFCATSYKMACDEHFTWSTETWIRGSIGGNKSLALNGYAKH